MHLMISNLNSETVATNPNAGDPSQSEIMTLHGAAIPSVNDVLGLQNHPLHAIFHPQSVAIIGATEREGSVGRTILWNLISHPFGGTVYPINPKRRNVLGIHAYATIADVPEPVDLAIIITPAKTVPSLVKECAAAGVKGAIVISAGFRETGAEGLALEKEVVAAAGKMRIIGPNCLGLMNPLIGLNATFASKIALGGNVAFISQSGAFCTAILDWSLQENVGFSAFVSIGSMADVDWGDLIEYFGDDPHTQSIAIYMESVGDARAFLSAAREVALAKPIVVLKAGRTDAAAKAVASHTGSLAGSDAALNAAFRRCGILRVSSTTDLFNMTELLAKHPRPSGNRLAIITNAGGPGTIATDALVEGGGQLAVISAETKEKLNAFLPKHWSHSNPIDILGDAEPERYAKTLEVVLQDENIDGFLVLLTPQAMTDPSRTAELLTQYVSSSTKPILACWMGGADVTPGRHKLTSGNVPSFAYPDAAAQAFNYMWRYAYNLRGIYETPSLPADDHESAPDRAKASGIINNAAAGDRLLLSEYEAKALLSSYGIPTVPTEIATSAAAAVDLAETMGYPVVLKLHSHIITHKTDVGGVKLNLRDANAVTAAYDAIAAGVADVDGAFLGVTVQPMANLAGYEAIVGCSQDEQFGPVMLFGSGGQLVEVFRDSALALPPLNTTLARRMMEQTQIYKALKGVRGRKPVDIEALSQLLVKFSQLVVEQPQIKEIEINPLLLSDQQILALDARVILHPTADLVTHPRRLAIRPYPINYIEDWTLKGGRTVNLRPIRPEDEPLMVAFHQGLSAESVYLRYAHQVKLQQRIAHERLARICFIDYDREMLIVADHNDAAGNHQLFGVARLSKLHGCQDAEFALIIGDQYQCQGLGTALMHKLIAVAKDEHIERIIGTILPGNDGMIHLCRKLGFTLHHDAEAGMIEATLDGLSQA